MAEELQTITHRELMADVVKVQQVGVPCGLFNKRTEPGFVLENGTVLLESEKDERGDYIGGAGMDGMFLRTPQRYRPLRGGDGAITAFCRVDPESVLNQIKAKQTRGNVEIKNRRQMER